MKECRHYLVVRGWDKEWNYLMNMEEVLKKHFEAEANGAEVASVRIKDTEAQIIFSNPQGKLCSRFVFFPQNQALKVWKFNP